MRTQSTVRFHVVSPGSAMPGRAISKPNSERWGNDIRRTQSTNVNLGKLIEKQTTLEADTASGAVRTGALRLMHLLHLHHVCLQMLAQQTLRREAQGESWCSHPGILESVRTEEGEGVTHSSSEYHHAGLLSLS